MKNLFVRILACVLVFTMAFAFTACKDEAADDAGKPATDPGKTQTPGNSDGWFDPIEDGEDDDDGDVCIACEDADGDLVCDVCGSAVEKPWSPWDEVKYFAIPNSSITTTNIVVDANGKVTSLELAKGSTMTFEFDYTVGAASSFELKFEGETVKVAFAADGKIAILKGEEQLAISAAAYTTNAKVTIDLTAAKLAVKVGTIEAVSASYTAPASGAEIYLIAGEGAKFENCKAVLGGSALEFETRNGTTWTIIEEEGYNKGAFYNGYSGNANGYQTLALVNNVNFDSAKKITISADIAMGADHRVTAADGTRSGNPDRGFLLEVWNTNGENETSPLFYENQNCSFYKVYLAGYGVSANSGKWGATDFSNDLINNKNGWHGLPTGKQGSPEEVSIEQDGPKNDSNKYVYQAENTFTTMDKGGEDAYANLKVEWNREDYILTYYYNNVLVRSIKFTRDIFVNDGSGVAIATASGDTYFRNFVLVVE